MTVERCDIRICEAVARSVLPWARAEMAYRLVHRYHLLPSTAAERLGLSRAAVSQYLKKKRGNTIPDGTPGMSDLIDLWARAVAGEDASVTLCDLCRAAGYTATEDD